MAKTNEPLEAIKAKTAKNKQESETAGLQSAGENAEKTASAEVVQPAVTEEKTTEETARKTTREQTGKAEKQQEAFIAPYRQAYPKEKFFHVTSDKQVFLEKDRGLAILHQNSLGNNEKVQTVRVK